MKKKSLIIAVIILIVGVTVTIFYRQYCIQHKPMGITPKDFKSIVLYDLDPRHHSYSTTARARASHYLLNDSEMSLFYEMEYSPGEEWTKGLILGEGKLEDGSTRVLFIGFAPSATLTIQDENGYWEGSDECLNAIIRIIQKEFIPARFSSPYTG